MDQRQRHGMHYKQLQTALAALDKIAAWGDSDEATARDEPNASGTAREALRTIRGGSGRPPKESRPAAQSLPEAAKIAFFETLFRIAKGVPNEIDVSRVWTYGYDNGSSRAAGRRHHALCWIKEFVDAAGYDKDQQERFVNEFNRLGGFISRDGEPWTPIAGDAPPAMKSPLSYEVPGDVTAQELARLGKPDTVVALDQTTGRKIRAPMRTIMVFAGEEIPVELCDVPKMIGDEWVATYVATDGSRRQFTDRRKFTSTPPAPPPTPERS